MKELNYEKGKDGENDAVSFLKKSGYSILERNFRFGRNEIDIIARTKEYLVFIEVKTRFSLDYGEPAAAVTLRKQAQIRKVAQYFLISRHIENTNIRFDVIAIMRNKNAPSEITHYENAF